MYIKAYAKINISLDIIGKREDGYHFLEMIMQSIDLYDLIKIDKCEQGINIYCNESSIPTDRGNLAYKAAELFADTYKIGQGLSISIEKNIPVSAGLAGGSSDAAAVLKGLSQTFGIHADDNKLKALGLKLGADVPYFITGGTAFCEGIGEICTLLRPFKNKIVVLVKPDFKISTPEVYKKIDTVKVYRHPNTKSIIKAINEDNLMYIGTHMVNVLENVTIRDYPVIENIKNEMVKEGSCGVLMSGSGPTVFGFFENMSAAQRCFNKMKKYYKEVFITQTI